MIIRPSLPSHGPVSASSRVHTCVSRRPIPTLLLFAGRTLILFTLPSPCPPRASVRSCTVGSWKCPGAPRRSAGSRGKNATLLIIKYARDGAREREGREGGNGLHVIHECTVWFGSTRQEIDDGSDEKISRAGGTLSGLS